MPALSVDVTRARSLCRNAPSLPPTTSTSVPPPAVSVDVTRAFDCVDIPLLLSLVEPLLQHEAYIVLKYQEVGR